MALTGKRPPVESDRPIASAHDSGDIIIRFDGVTKAFGPTVVLREVSLSIKRGSVNVVCGASGSGKSTLLRCINGLELPQKGKLTVLGRVLDDRLLASPAFRADVGMVFQRFSLYPHMTALDNVALALRKCGDCRGLRRASEPRRC